MKVLVKRIILIITVTLIKGPIQCLPLLKMDERGKRERERERKGGKERERQREKERPCE